GRCRCPIAAPGERRLSSALTRKHGWTIYALPDAASPLDEAGAYFRVPSRKPTPEGIAPENRSYRYQSRAQYCRADTRRQPLARSALSGAAVSVIEKNSRRNMLSLSLSTHGTILLSGSPSHRPSRGRPGVHAPRKCGNRFRRPGARWQRFPPARVRRREGRTAWSGDLTANRPQMLRASSEDIVTVSRRDFLKQSGAALVPG